MSLNLSPEGQLMALSVSSTPGIWRKRAGAEVISRPLWSQFPLIVKGVFTLFHHSWEGMG